MFLVTKLGFEKDKHVSTQVIRTFKDKEHAIQYLENCRLLQTYMPSKEQYKLEKL